MCSMILLALNTFLATPGCVAPGGAATAAAQSWGAYSLNGDYSQAIGYVGAGQITEIWPVYQRSDSTVVAGAISNTNDAFLGFTWFADSQTLVVTTTYAP